MRETEGTETALMGKIGKAVTDKAETAVTKLITY